MKTKTGENPIADVDESPLGRPADVVRLVRPSTIVLVASNLIPLYGVLFAGWQAFPIMLLFSLENIVIGFYNVLRMRLAPCDLAELKSQSKGINSKRGLIAFFCVHYGIFVFGHLLFVVVIFGLVMSSANEPSTVTAPSGLSDGANADFHFEGLPKEAWLGIGAAFVGLWISHGVSFVYNFVKAGEYKRVTANKLFIRPYGRLLAMHATIIFGGFLAVFTGTSITALAMLVVLKLIVDLFAHLSERKKFLEARPA